MDTKTALHTAARRFCQDRFSEWAQAYNDLQLKENSRAENLFEPGWDYSEDAYRVFPRYRIDAVIQAEVERLIPDSAKDLAELRSQLNDACKLAENRLLEEFAKASAREAIREEAADFKAYLQVLEDGDLADIALFPTGGSWPKKKARNSGSNSRKFGVSAMDIGFLCVRAKFLKMC
jgi:hypothetical protein